MTKMWLCFCRSAIYGTHGTVWWENVFVAWGRVSARSVLHSGKTLLFVEGISPQLRKIALKLKQRKVIEQQGDQYIIKTTSPFRNYTISFRVGQEFEEFTKGLDDRRVKVKTRGWWQRIVFKVITSFLITSVFVCDTWDVFYLLCGLLKRLCVVIYTVYFSAICAVTGDMGGEQTGVWTDWREEGPGLGSLDWRWQATSGKNMDNWIIFVCNGTPPPPPP